MVYRRGPEQMKASAYERELAQTSGVVIRYWARPVALEGRGDTLSGVVFESGNGGEGASAPLARSFASTRTCCFSPSDSAARRKRSTARRSRSGTAASSSMPSAARRLRGVWAGGDCVYGGQDLTVSAVEDGKQAARSIAAALGASRA